MDDLSLDTRKGLPEHLRVLADLYPREIWTGHPNFGGLTAFWLERHLNFRQVLDTLIDGSERHLDRHDPRYGHEMQRYTSFFLNQLHHHHMIEDQHYFPQFLPLDSRLEQAFELLDRDHHALDGHIHGLAEASNAVLKRLAAGEDEKVAADLLLRHQRDFKVFLNRHLEDEEEIIVPVILEYGADTE
ncbi:hemerythrin domain-containing protein [Pseudooceanicola sp. 216_PA32_1]|uniref:Hemerythrin domain-containing protein n=1 Tax=Pseudooceanicola pacificus TaxID=2676438 RepID=A0A844WDN2_9RHOB|nr:hemerythrin domain-containing protein [Pseudooceanicola pacificus]MWB77840.1 hemerythrin domain-containing protein [Pseudooceanicola pacificus]